MVPACKAKCGEETTGLACCRGAGNWPLGVRANECPQGSLAVRYSFLPEYTLDKEHEIQVFLHSLFKSGVFGFILIL